MERLSSKLVFFVFFMLLLHSWTASSSEVENEKEFDYHEKSGKGPSKWGEIHEEWGLCGNGRMQSPIDMLNQRVEIISQLGRLQRSYKPSNATLKNRGHDMMMKWESGAGHIEINGTKYELKQAHWHSPSEHTIEGEKFNVELHLVHETPDAKIAVVSILYKIGTPDSFLSSLESSLKEITDKHEEERAVGIIDPRHIKIGSRKYYRYIGSLTVPPCTQNVVWTIVKKVRTVTREQIKMLRVAVHDESNTNARPVQALNKRPIHLYRPNESQGN